MFPDVFLHPLVDIRKGTEGEHPTLVVRIMFLILPPFSPSPNLAIFINVSHCRCHIKCQTIHGWSMVNVVPVVAKLSKVSL